MLHFNKIIFLNHQVSSRLLWWFYYLWFEHQHNENTIYRLALLHTTLNYIFYFIRLWHTRRTPWMIYGWEPEISNHGFFLFFFFFFHADSVSRAKGVLTRVVRLAQRYLLDPMGRQRAEEKASQTQTKPRQCSPPPGRVIRSRTSASLTQAQVKLCYKHWLCSSIHSKSLRNKLVT